MVAGTQTRSGKKDFEFSERTGMLPLRDPDLRSSAVSLTHVSHSGRRTARRELAPYQAVNSPDDRCQHDERLLEGRWIPTRRSALARTA